MNILLIAGGWSSERDVSLASGKVIGQALQNLGHVVERFDPAESLEGLMQAVKGKDFAFIALHGSPGEDGLIQAMLDRAGCPYQGAGPAGSVLAINKAASKVLFAGAGLKTAPWLLINALPDRDWRPELKFPLFIKANTGGSSLHMEQVTRPDDLYPALQRLFALGNSYLMESAVDGAEITCAVISERKGTQEEPIALPPILIKPSTGSVFDYTSKYAPGGAEEICPAPISAELTARIQEMALKAHRVLGLTDYSRSDFIVPDDGQPVLLETNTLPGMTSGSLLPKAAAAYGLTFEGLVARLLELGMAKKA